MAKIVVAFSDRQLARRIAQELEAAGFEVFRFCVTGDEVKRAFNVLEDGVLVCGARFPDQTVEALAGDLAPRALILVIEKTERPDFSGLPDLYTLQTPFSARELTASVNMLLQMHYKRLPHRVGHDKELVERAKEKLMRERGLTESEAHHFLQKESMRRGERMMDSARKILEK